MTSQLLDSLLDSQLLEAKLVNTYLPS